LLASHDPNLPQLAAPVGVKKRATINRFFDRVLSTKRVTKSLNLKQPKVKKSFIRRKTDKSSRMLMMHPKLSVLKDSTSVDGHDSSSCCQQLPHNRLNQQVPIKTKQQHSPFTNYSTNGRTVEVEAVVEPHAYQPAWGLETEVHKKKPSPDLHGFEIQQEQLGSPSSGYTSINQSETSSTNRNSDFSNYSTSSTESPNVMWREVDDDTGIKCATMIRRSCSMNSFPMMDNSSECQTIQEHRKHSQESTNSDQPINDFPGLHPKHRSRSVEILIDTDSSTELSPQTDSCFSSQEEATTDMMTVDQRPENLIMSFKMKYSASQQPSAPHKSRIFFIKAKKIKAPFRLFRNKHTSDSSQANKSPSSTSVSRYNN